jgi:flagellar motor switch protein FliG
VSREASGAKRAALLLVSLGRERAARILQSLNESEIEQIMSEIAELGEIDESEMSVVMAEFVTEAAAKARTAQGGAKVARDLLTETLGDGDKAEALLTRIGGAPPGSSFRAIMALDATVAASLLAREHPQVAALVLSKLPPERALGLLRELPDTLKGDVAYRIATMTPTPPEVLRTVEAGLERRIISAATGQRLRADNDPLKPLIEILTRADAETEKGVLEQMGDIDARLAQDIRQRLFTMEDLVKLDDKAVQLLLREVDSRSLALSLKGTSEAIRNKIFRNLSERAQANLREEIELLGPQRLSEVEEARKEVIRSVRHLEQSGSIVLSRGNDDFVD